MKFFMSWILLNFWCNLQVVTTNECFNDLVCIPSGYKRHIRPPPKNGTTNIKVEFEKIQILNIDENEGTITIKFSLASVWSDPRIFVSPNATDEDKKRITTTRKTGYLELIDLPRYFKNRLWLPNPYIANAHKINKYKVHDDFDVLYYGLYGNMTLLSHRIELETIIFCKMNFDSYPMDKHSCYFTLGSYAFLKQSGQRFILADFKTRASIQFNNSDQVAQLDFEIIDVKELPKGMKNCWDNYGMSQRTGFEIKFQRKFQRYIDAYYFPSGILVVLSWIGFVIPPEVIPGRMALLTTLFLTEITITMGIILKSPRSDGTTNIMQWMTAWELFVFFALLEFGLVLFCRSVFKYKSLPKDYGEKQLMKLDFTCLLASMISFACFVVIFLPITI